MPHALDYSRPIVGRDTNAADEDLLPLAIYCALAPLCLLVATFLLWLATRWTFLEFFGLWTILLGLIMFIVGGVCIVAYIPSALLSSREPARRILIRAGVVMLLLLLNMPVDVAIIAAVRAINPTLIGL